MGRSSGRRKRDAIHAQERAEKAARIQPLATSLEDSVESCVAALAQALEQPGDSEKTTLEVPQALNDPNGVSVPMISSGIPTTQKDKILNWNHALHLWLKSGTYITPLVPPIEVEVARHFKVQALSTFLLESCDGGLKMPAFERWLLDSRVENKSPDPVLSPSSPKSPATRRLLEEMVEGGKMERKAAGKVLREFCQRNTLALHEITEQYAQHQHHNAPFKKGDRIELEKPEDIVRVHQDDDTKSKRKHRRREVSTCPLWTLVYHRKTWKKPFVAKIRPDHYQKLHTLFFRIHNIGPYPPNGESNPRVLHIFHLLLLILLTRYSSLSGGQLLMDLRGGGMQGAIHAAAFDVLQSFFGGTDRKSDTAEDEEEPDKATGFTSKPAKQQQQPLAFYEGFGSPMNCCWSAFGSAFPEDLDWHFGSLGGFLQLDYQRGVVEANPPFAPGMMDQMHQHIERCLAKTKDALTFVVVVPDGGDPSSSERSIVKKYGSKPLENMLASSFRRHHILLRAKEHGYIEGAQHMRSTRFKESLYDTSVVVFQSEAAFKNNDDFDRLEKELREAFASRHRDEVERRKHDKEESTKEDE